MKKIIKFLLVGIIVLAAPLLMAAIQGDLIRMGIFSDGRNVEIIDGTFEVNSTSQFDGAVTSAATVTLDDGSGASPSFVLKDATDETATFSKVDSGNITVTTLAADGLQVLTGNFSVGNGTPGVALGGEDAYVEGTFEVDGAAQFDGAVSATSTLAVTGAITGKKSIVVYNTSATPRTITAAESGTVFVVAASDGTTVTFNLPAAVAGLVYTIVDNDATATHDVIINPDDADKIQNGSAGVSYDATGDAFGEVITLVAVDGENWVKLGEDVGTWGTGS